MLYVVPLAAEAVEQLTLGEWDRLLAADKVLFEDPSHPLIGRLRNAGGEAGPFDDEPSAAASGLALVARPESPRLLELARDGADVSPASSASPDPVSSAHAAGVVRRAQAALGTLVVIMARLRSEDGCPWDNEQTHASLQVHLIEEAHEVLEAISAGATGAELEDELGDVLLQVFFHARLAEQDGRFDIAGVADGIVDKLIRRHPHVFGERTVTGSAEVVANWEEIKRGEKNRGPFDGIPGSLPALLRAYKVQKRATASGYDASAEAARGRLDEALEKGEIGDALFWLVAVGRAAGVDPESALLAATNRFKDGFPQ